MSKLALIPVLLQASLTLGLALAMGSQRVRALREGRVRMKDIALGQPNWPVTIMAIDRAFHNQLELPLMFLGLVALAAATHAIGPVFIALEWVFVALRFAHAYVHVTSNDVPTRFYIFAAGFAALVALWVTFAIAALG